MKASSVLLTPDESPNRWAVLAAHIPRWDKLARVYYTNIPSDFGPPTLAPRMVIGTVIIKPVLNIDDWKAAGSRDRGNRSKTNVLFSIDFMNFRKFLAIVLCVDYQYTRLGLKKIIKNTEKADPRPG